MPRLSLPALLLLALPLPAAEPGKPNENKRVDRRLSTVRTLNDKDFFFRPPATLPAWQARRQAVREQILVATGLWPLPPRTALAPTVHGKIRRDGYTVEKVYFASHPGHYVSGNLYRPADAAGKPLPGKKPGVLSPHGHWRDGRFYDAGAKAAQAQLDKKAEKTLAGARYPLQARCAQLARMGCVVFHYDMVGYADSRSLDHEAFHTPLAELHLQSLMGLQTWNSLRALDFLTGLPDVDARRVGVTGASGGGTQTFLLCGIDDRPAAAFPAVMVSTAMQGGCVCENCSYLRLGTGNVEFAALFAPKPLAMTGANDWTLDIERKGLPELKAVYNLYGKPQNVTARCFPTFEHNYNQLAREMMYDWFNKHLDLKQPSPVLEKPFLPVPPKELSVYDAQHPRPADSRNATALQEYLTEVADRQLAGLRPADAAGLAEYRRVVGAALRVMAGGALPLAKELEVRPREAPKVAGATAAAFTIGRRGQGEAVPTLVLRGKAPSGTVVVWIDPKGKASLLEGGKPAPAVAKMLQRGATVVSVDVFGTGELSPNRPAAVNPRMAGFTFGYNRPLLAQRVHDVLSAVAFARKHEKAKAVHLVGQGKAGPWVLLARGLCGAAVSRTAADVNRFRFDAVRKTTDEMMLPGALKYGGLAGLAGVAAPGELYLHNQQGSGVGRWLKAVYQAAGAADNLSTQGDRAGADKVVAWLLR
jgi:dienelactone hydrolase